MRRLRRRDWTPKTIALLVTFVLLLGFGFVDFWKGDSGVYDGEVIGKHSEYRSGSDNSSGSTTYYLEVITDQDFGIPSDISVWHGKYRKFHTGDSCKVEIAKGGITGFTYYTRVR